MAEGTEGRRRRECILGTFSVKCMYTKCVFSFQRERLSKIKQLTGKA